MGREKECCEVWERTLLPSDLEVENFMAERGGGGKVF